MSVSATFKLYGAAYSVYARIARLVLEEALAQYDWLEVDIFDKASLPQGFAALHPFSKIPVLQHGDFTLYETDAIARYVLDVTGCSELMPGDARARARALQIMRIVDNYGYPSLVWGLYAGEREGASEPASPATIDRAATSLGSLERARAGRFLAGDSVSLADLWTVPVIAYARQSPTAAKLLEGHPGLLAWWREMSARASVIKTRFDGEDD